jgi:hypothetical protein
MRGTFQSEFNAWFAFKLTGRQTYTALFNQILYNVFHSSSSQYIIGKDSYIFDRPSLFNEVPEERYADIDAYVAILKELSTELMLLNKPLIVTIVNGKENFYYSYLPDCYKRYLKMWENGEYGVRWSDLFKDKIAETDVLVLDTFDRVMEQTRAGEITWTKGGGHQTQVTTAEYVNGINGLIERSLDKKLGKLVVHQTDMEYGKPQMAQDCDIWNLTWNCFYMPPKYYSPKVQFSSRRDDYAPNLYIVGDSFSWLPVNTVYGLNGAWNWMPSGSVWNSTDQQWYASYVMNFPLNKRIFDSPADPQFVLNHDAIIIELLDKQIAPGMDRFMFARDLLDYIKSIKSY